MRLIDADALIASLGLQNCKKYGNADAKELADSYGLMPRYEIKDEIDGAPTIDAVEVVRCKDCADFRPWGGQSKLGDCMVYVCDGENPFTMEETDFCSDGERRS